MKNIAMLTTFQGYLESYSLCQVARQQLKMLKKAEYDVRFIYRGGGGWEGTAKEIVEIPDYIIDNDGNYEGMEQRAGKKFPELVQDTLQALERVLQGIDTVITHDLIYQESNKIQDEACILYAEKHPELQWLHWIHSATTSRNRNILRAVQYRNSFLIYPNSWDVPRVARNFGYEEPDVKVVPHPIDFEEFFDWHPLTTRLVEEKGMMTADVIGCYPLRLDRGKLPEMALEIFNQIKLAGRSIRFVIVDFQSTGGDKVKYREEMQQQVAKWGWQENELTFMSQFDKTCNLQTPKKIVRDLMLLSNVYIHPSKSETYSYTTQEARACRNLLVLNFDFPAMASIYGAGPLYKKFGSCVDVLSGSDGETKTTYPKGVAVFAKEVALSILYHLENQSVLAGATETRQNKNMTTVFKRKIEPLFYSK